MSNKTSNQDGNPVVKNKPFTKWFRYFTLALAISIFLTIVVGGIVSSIESGEGCLDWPTCLGHWVLPSGLYKNMVLFDYLHRFLTLVSGTMIAAGLLFSIKFFSTAGWLKKDFLLISGITILQILLGGLLSQGWFNVSASIITAIHLILSIIVLVVLVWIIVVLFHPNADFEHQPIIRMKSSHARWYVLTVILYSLLTVSGIFLSGIKVPGICNGNSIITNILSCLASTSNAGFFISHQILVVSTGIVLTFLFLYSWKTQRSQIPILVATTMAFVLFYAQALLGIKMANDQSAYLIALHHVTAIGFLTVLAVGFFSTGILGRDQEAEIQEGTDFRLNKRILKDLLMLTKPVVVLLLLVTTYAGMVIAGKSWPTFTLTFWTMLAGFMAAGGSGAINQFIDRYDDGRMQRTNRRPIPAGRLSPAEGLAFGIGMLLVSFYMMVAFVNLLAAILSLAGMIYYVLIYSILLKKTTVQNIVIGGGAGAIPPLVGWAAVTGSLNVPSMFLFVLVFMWTPPHFWALALVRRKDYARAGVPMLPVIRGEKETRKQILGYTIVMVILTLFLPVFGLGGNIYLFGAGILGVWILQAAWKVWKNGGNKLAWKMYRYSSMYLAFIFLVLMVDALL